jgi:hypothetical protein
VAGEGFVISKAGKLRRVLVIKAADALVARYPGPVRHQGSFGVASLQGLLRCSR